MFKLPDLLTGVYQHYKGPLYLVLGYAHDANDEKRVVVVYIGLELDEAHTGPRLAIREVGDFFSKLCSVKDCSQYGRNPWAYSGHDENHITSRFTYIGPQYLV